ncbi:hypothetical protein EGW08_014875 [Elysia chlorotica]|uniref:SET domain-containing protein n=1 Tax=Elysia chlorotica TaxID=188477 RepID=A0A433T6Z5_ELYCH|nr:hypothetical protein EGW08_014875 [Elysia chlorotica]
MTAKPKKYVKGLTKVEILTQGLMRPSDEVKANFSIKEDEKGRGVYLKIPELSKGSFVLEYEGDIITPDEVEHRELIYESNGEGCFIMEFKFNGSSMAIDATRNFNSYTRLLNHSRHPNIRFHSPIVVDFSDPPKPRIAAYALRDIKRGEEIVFDYGVKDRSIPWLKNRKNGFAEVSGDEDEDNNSKDDESSTSSDNAYLCLRYTAARAGRSNLDDRPAFNYRELSRSASSSSDNLSQSSQHHKKTRNKKRHSRESTSVPDSDKSNPGAIPQASLDPSNNLGFDSINQSLTTAECRWNFDRLRNGKFRVTLSRIAVPQKILKCLEPKRKSRKTESSSSIICLSDESSPSHESGSDSDSKDLMDIPVVSSEKKVMDWQNSFCCGESAQNTVSEENTLSIKIVGVQSLSDSPEHTLSSTEPVHQKTDHANLPTPVPVVCLERLPSNLSVHESQSISALELVSPRLTDSISIKYASPSRQHHSPHMPGKGEHNSPSFPNCSPSVSTSKERMQTTTQGITMQPVHFVSTPSPGASHLVSTNLDLPSSSTGSSNHVLSRPSPKPESPLTISDSEDQPSFVPNSSMHKSLVSSEEQKHLTGMQFNHRASSSQNVYNLQEHKRSRNSMHQPRNFSAKSLENFGQTCLQDSIPTSWERDTSPHQGTSRSPQSIRNPHSQHSYASKSQPPKQPQNCLPRPPQNRILPQVREYTSPVRKSHLSSQYQGKFPASISGSHENQNSFNNLHSFVDDNLSGKQVESFVISDDEDNVSVKKIDCAREAVGKNSYLSQRKEPKEQNVLVLSSDDEPDVEEIVPPPPQRHPSSSLGMGNTSTSKFEPHSSAFTQNGKSNFKTDDSECHLVLVEHSSQSALATKRVAVIQPYKSDPSDTDMSQWDNALTDAEMDRLSDIFDRNSFSKNVSKTAINEKIYNHWNFFKSILERGISVEQIRAAVKQMCLVKYNTPM